MPARAHRLQFVPPRQTPVLVDVMKRLVPWILKSRGGVYGLLTQAP